VIPAGSQSTARGLAAGRSTPRAVEHPLAEVRAEQEQIAAKARWTLIVREHIARTLLETGFVHSDDLDSLGIPDEHRNIAGSQMGGFVQRGLMVEVGRRASIKPSRKKAKSAIYRITDKGRRELTIGVSTEDSQECTNGSTSGGTKGKGVAAHVSPSPVLSAHSGGQTAGLGTDTPQPVRVESGEQTAHREGTPHSQEPARHPMPVPSASSQSGGSGATSQASEPARELQRGRDCQVRGAGSPSAGRNQAQAEAEAADATRRTAETQPARLFTPPPMSAITNQEAA
jgi:hypothetical protein